MLHFLTDLSSRGSKSRSAQSSGPPSGKAAASTEPDQWAQMIARGRTRQAFAQEPSLEEVLNDPVIKRMMKSDAVDPSDIRRFADKK